MSVLPLYFPGSLNTILIQLKIFKPDFIIWMDTIKKGRYEDMNKLFKAPKQYDLRIKEKKINESIKKFKKKFLHFEFTY